MKAKVKVIAYLQNPEETWEDEVGMEVPADPTKKKMLMMAALNAIKAMGLLRQVDENTLVEIPMDRVHHFEVTINDSIAIATPGDMKQATAIADASRKLTL